MTKEEKFNDLIFKSFQNNENFELIKYSMNRARGLMLQHLVFDKASATHQYDMCMTIYIIGTQSGTKAMHNLRLFVKPEERSFKYALDEGFEPPKTINSKEIKLIE